MLIISNTVYLAEKEIDLSAIRAQGSGGQHVNKTSTAIHLRFNIQSSSLPAIYKEKLLTLANQRINKEGIIIIKAQQFRSQAKNKKAALARLITLIQSVVIPTKKRHLSKISFGKKQRRMDKKTQRGKDKVLRKKIDF